MVFGDDPADGNLLACRPRIGLRLGLELDSRGTPAGNALRSSGGADTVDAGNDGPAVDGRHLGESMRPGRDTRPGES